MERGFSCDQRNRWPQFQRIRSVQLRRDRGVMDPADFWADLPTLASVVVARQIFDKMFFIWNRRRWIHLADGANEEVLHLLERQVVVTSIWFDGLPNGES
ncbi:unnamed protein product [Protopolystoma xenopodis]|uniref:Uncharacterized protein n=1 Tax=Protopolystoma xenopodis TaxID=117903 RepID=A0A3S5C2B1_9PLAT|nr:unnamed protein product [Protopolystoma xenopodis]